MRMRRLPDRGRARAAGAAFLLAAALLLVAGASGAEQPAADAAGWESLLGERPSAQLGGRWIVVLAKPSLATRVAAAGGVATEEQERAWTAAARDAQNEVIARLVFAGPDRAGARVLPGAQRVRDPARRPRPCDRRARSRRAGRVPGAGGDPGRGRPGGRRRARRRRRREAPEHRHPRVLGQGCHRRAPRHGCRPRPPVHSLGA